ncbi:MAG: NAD(P)/FAD-dependent oxidoreductase, partial [Verrucomicrobiota bacterium]
VIIGAGLSGLSAAKTLAAYGQRNVVVLEKSCQPGGRVRTMDYQGYRLDAGFQVALSSYPVFHRAVPKASLSPRFFGCGALVEESGGELRCLAHPLRHPGHIFDALASEFALRDKLKLVALVGKCLATPAENLLIPVGETAAAYLSKKGFSANIIDSFFRPFFGGVFLDNALRTDASLLLYYLKNFATGRAFLPQGGIEGIVDQLVSDVPDEWLHFDQKVTKMEGTNVTTHKGETFSGDAVIVAGDPAFSGWLLDLPGPKMKATKVAYFSSDQPLYDGGWITLPRREGRLVQHFVQISNVDPSLAPAGKHLLSATILNDQNLADDKLFSSSIAEIAQHFPEAKGCLSPLKIIDVPVALPAQSPEYFDAFEDAESQLPAGVFLAGDLCSNASIQNAISSGERAAQKALDRW